EVRVRQRVGGDFARQLADRMAPHAVGHHEVVTVIPPRLGVVTDLHPARVLVVLAAESDVTDGRELNLLFPPHERSRTANPRIVGCRRDAIPVATDSVRSNLGYRASRNSTPRQSSK